MRIQFLRLFVLILTAWASTASAAGPVEFKTNGYDNLPPGVASWAATSFKGVALTDAAHSATTLDTTAKVLHRVKAVDAEGKLLVAVFDGGGQLLADRGEALMKAEREAYQSKYGAVRPDLVAKLSATQGNVAIRTSIWLRTTEPTFAREDLIANPLLVAEQKACAEFLQDSAKASLMKDWGSLVSAPITFQSGTPLAEAYLTPVEIAAIAKHPAIARIYGYDEPVHTNSTVWHQAINATNNGVDGTGFEICVLEGGKPNDLTYTSGIPASDGYACSAGTTSVASRWAAEIARTNSTPAGSAPGALTPIGNWNGSNCSGDASTAMQWCSQTRAARIWGWPNTSTGALNDLMDYNVKRSPYPTICASAGNSGSSAVTTSLAYNVLNVGGTDDNETAARADDTLYTSTSSLNPTYTDRELPTISAPGVNIETASGTVASGTSASTFMCTGAAAQILEKNTSLQYWPEAIRAIMICGADENIDGPRLDLTDNVDDKDGAGEINVEKSVSIAGSVNKVDRNNTPRSSGHDYETMASSDFYLVNDLMVYNGIYYAQRVTGGNRLRVVLVWDATATCTDPSDASTCGTSVLDGDFDLKVYNVTKDEVADMSLSWDNGFEFVEVPDPDGDVFAITISGTFASGVSSTYMGIAWNISTYAQ